MDTYRITQGDIRFTVEADSYEEAAHLAARKLLKTRSKAIVGLRTTGDNGKSGMFNAYRKRGSGYGPDTACSAVGSNFHVMRL